MKDYSLTHVFGFQAVAGIELILFGLFLMLASHRFLKATLYTSVYIFCHSLVLLLCYKIRPTAPYVNTKRQTLYLLISQLMGITLSIGINKAVIEKSWKAGETAWETLGNAVLGCLSGLSLGIYVLASSSSGIFNSISARVLLVFFAVTFLSGLMISNSRQIKKVCTAIVGAYLLILGIDCFARTGYFNHFVLFFGLNHQTAFAAGNSAMVLHAMALVFSLIAGLWQQYDIRAVLQSREWNWSA